MIYVGKQIKGARWRQFFLYKMESIFSISNKYQYWGFGLTWPVYKTCWLGELASWVLHPAAASCPSLLLLQAEVRLCLIDIFPILFFLSSYISSFVLLVLLYKISELSFSCKISWSSFSLCSYKLSSVKQLIISIIRDYQNIVLFYYTKLVVF